MNTSTRWGRNHGGAALGVVAAIVLQACGGGDSPQNTPDGGGTCLAHDSDAVKLEFTLTHMSRPLPGWASIRTG